MSEFSTLVNEANVDPFKHALKIANDLEIQFRCHFIIIEIYIY